MSSAAVHEYVLAACERLSTFEQCALDWGNGPAAAPVISQLRSCLSDDPGSTVLLYPADLRARLELVTSKWQLQSDSVDLPWLLVESSGYISAANAAVGRLLNLSARCLRGRPLQLFVGRERASFSSWLRALRFGQPVETCALLLRPRERRPKEVSVLAAVDTNERITLLFCEHRPEAA